LEETFMEAIGKRHALAVVDSSLRAASGSASDKSRALPGNLFVG